MVEDWLALIGNMKGAVRDDKEPREGVIGAGARP